MVEWLKDFITNVANKLGLDFWLTACLGLAAILLVVLAIVLIIVAAVKHKSAKKSKAVTVAAKANIEKSAPAKAEVATEKPAEAEMPAEKPVAQAVEKTEPQSAKKEDPKRAAEPVKAEKPAAEVKKATEKPATAKKTVKAEKPVKTEKTEKPEKPEKTKKAESKPAVKNGKAKALGKWIIERKSDDEYLALLAASNGEIMLTSETYVSEDGARKGIATIVKAVTSGEFVIYKTKNGTFYFKLKSASNRLLCAGEIYKDKAGCESAVESVKRIAAESPVTEEVSEGEKYVAYTPVNLADNDLKSAAKGKWKVEATEDGKFYATLYASNGQLMLSTEEVSTRATALAGIENVKKNSLAGNFVIDKDKFGKFYYKLRNSNKSVICIGESYPSAERCISALESVRKFAMNSPLAEDKPE